VFLGVTFTIPDFWIGFVIGAISALGALIMIVSYQARDKGDNE
jgi:hypothetical protein